MLRRCVPQVLVALAVALFASQATSGDKDHEGLVVKAGGGKLTMTFKGDTKKHTHDVAKDAKISLDGKSAKLEEPKEGFHVSVRMDAKHVLTRIDAHSKKK